MFSPEMQDVHRIGYEGLFVKELVCENITDRKGEKDVIKVDGRNSIKRLVHSEYYEKKNSR